jgi:hypothetical protein
MNDRRAQLRPVPSREIEAIAVVGLCAAERRRYAMALAGARGYVFVPAEQTVQGIDVIDRLVAPGCDDAECARLRPRVRR